MKRIQVIFSLWTLQGLAGFIWLASLPTNAERGILAGLSTSRLALLGIMLGLTMFSAGLVWVARRSIDLKITKYYWIIYVVTSLIALSAPAVILVLVALGRTTSFTFTAYAGRLTPLATWLTLSGLELGVFLTKELRIFQTNKAETRSLLHFSVISSVCLAVVVIFISITKLGITQYNDGSWGGPSTPLLEWQIILALSASLIFIGLEKRWQWIRNDRTTGLCLYAFTCIVWISQPIIPGFFATPPRAPNFEIYPFSDALIYAQYAQSALVGNGFMWPDVPTRPLYITFITWLHAIAGQNYVHVIMLQSLVLAAFPVVLFFIGKELAGRPLGLGLAILATFRDLTANIAAPFALNYTYTKLFFSEIPAALLMSLFTLMILRWMRQPKPIWYALLAGGLLGLSSLIRLQSAVLMAAVIPIGFLVITSRKKWLVGSALMLAGLVLALLPWLARNYVATGGLVVDNPISQTMVLARRWSGDNGNALIPRLTGEGDAQYSSRMGALALASLRADPGRILGSAVNHFFNNEIGNLLVFPLRDQLDSPGDLIWPRRAFWQAWNGLPGREQIPTLVIYLALLGVGLGAAFRNNRLVGLLPLALSLVYNAWTALFLSSGDRFLVPMDWTIYLYLFLGLLTLSNLWLRGNSTTGSINPQNEKMDRMDNTSIQWKNLGLTALFILACGASLPLTELAFPKLSKPSAVLQTSKASGGEISLYGRAIYPRWYGAKEGEPGTAKMGYGEMEQARLVFFLVGDKNSLVIFPIRSAPKYFPNAADVAITGTMEDGYIKATKIIVQKDGQSAEYHP